MAKPAKIKKKQAAPPPSRKERKKAALKGGKGGEAVVVKGKEKKQAAGGIKGRISRAQAAKAAKGGGRAGGRGRGIVKFLREVRGELSKVTWPNREELVQSTIVVLVAVVIAGVYIALFDLIFSRLIGMLS